MNGNQNTLNNYSLFEDKGILAMHECILRVFLRKDMSLNRRVFDWILGGRNDDADIEYFKQFSKIFTVQSLRKIFSSIPHTTEEAKLPFKVCFILL